MKAIIPRVYIIYGIMGSGKTMFSTSLSKSYYRVFANYNIDGHENFTLFKKTESIKNIKFGDNKGLLILDESLVNVNSKDFHSKNNRFLIEEVLVYCRKLNLDLAFVTQIFDAIDKNIRKLATHIIKCQNIGNENYPFFLIEYQKNLKNDIQTVLAHKVDLLKILRLQKLSYNTLEMSTNEKINASKLKKEYKEQEIEENTLNQIKKRTIKN